MSGFSPMIDVENGQKVIDYPFPLRRNVTAYIKLPADLTLAEVERITEFLKTLCEEEKRME